MLGPNVSGEGGFSFVSFVCKTFFVVPIALFEWWFGTTDILCCTSIVVLDCGLVYNVASAAFSWHRAGILLLAVAVCVWVVFFWYKYTCIVRT